MADSIPARHEQPSILVKWMMIENIATLGVTAATIVALYWLGAGLWAFGAGVLLWNLNVISWKNDHG